MTDILYEDFSSPIDSKKWGMKSYLDKDGVQWDPSCISVVNGNLVITAKKVGAVWHSGFLSGKIEYQGARHSEARAKLASGLGVWNGPIWEWPYPYGAGTLENDICEKLGREPHIYHTTLHNWSVSPERAKGYPVTVTADMHKGFHVYGSSLYPDHVDYFFDGKKVSTVLASDVGLADLTVWPVCINISLYMGGWGGPIEIAGPASMYVDYIKVSAL